MQFLFSMLTWSFAQNILLLLLWLVLFQKIKIVIQIPTYRICTLPTCICNQIKTKKVTETKQFKAIGIFVSANSCGVGVIDFAATVIIASFILFLFATSDYVYIHTYIHVRNQLTRTSDHRKFGGRSQFIFNMIGNSALIFRHRWTLTGHLHKCWWPCARSYDCEITHTVQRKFTMLTLS